MWLFARILPAMVGQFVPEEDENWCNLLAAVAKDHYLFVFSKDYM